MNIASAAPPDGLKTSPASRKRAPKFSWATGWIILCAFANVVGWGLSALRQLNPAGYAVAFSIGGVAVVLAWWKIQPRLDFVTGRLKLQKRFRRWLPGSFLILSLLAILGGFLYAPNNYDALAYRIPRVLRWLAEGHWHWIHTDFHRLNTRACGMEWVAAPMLALTGSDRWLFLINAAGQLLLPGLVFSVFTQLGVHRRVAWVWMWLLPTGYCFLLQAGGIGNDMFGSIFPLAALHFAMRAAKRPNLMHALLAVLGAALTSSSKTSNLPLLLPVAVALLPSWRLLLRHPVVTSLVTAVAVIVSFFPTAVMNARHCGDWTGAKAEHMDVLRGNRPLMVVNNSWLLVIQNFVPPVFPYASKWNEAVLRYMPKKLHDQLSQTVIEAGAAEWSLAELQWEVNAGLGLGVSGLLLAGFWGRRQRDSAGWGLNYYQISVLAGIGIAFLAYLVCMSLSALSRETAPYYALVIPFLLLSLRHASAIRLWWWRTLAAGALLLALLVLIITPPRPLWPVEAVLGGALQHGNSSRIARLAADTYAVNRSRSDAFAPLRAALPDGETIVGMVTGDDPETSMWRPFGSRRIVHVLPADTGAELRRQGVNYILVNPSIFQQYFGRTMEQWLAEIHGEVFKTVPVTLKGTLGPKDWPIVALPHVSP